MKLRRSFIGDEFILLTVNRRALAKISPWTLLLILVVLPLGGCDPIFDVAGAYFPSWIICVIAGGIGTLFIRDILVRLGLDPHLGWKVVSYLGLFLMFSASIWLVFFST